MNTEKQQYVQRDNILKLLSDEEAARVSTAETEKHLAGGDEYLDLEALDRGVQEARGEGVVMGRVLPRKAVHENTWSNIINQLKKPTA